MKVPFILETLPKPDPVALSNNEVIVQVKASALCHTELHFVDGTLNLGVKPIILGHEAVGVITSGQIRCPQGTHWWASDCLLLRRLQ